MRANHRQRARLVSVESGAMLATLELADTPLARMVGLLGRDELADDDGLLIDPCHSIHTWFMRFPIDVLFMTREGEVVTIFDALPPFRLASGTRRARLTIELPAGARRRANLVVGSHLKVEAA